MIADPTGSDGQLLRARRVSINEEFAPVEAYIDEYVADISASGVFIRSKDPLPIGTHVDLRFSLILDELHVIEAAGEVVRHGPAGMGVAFRMLSLDAAQMVGRAVRARVERRS